MQRETVKISRSLLELLAPEQPINDDESGGCIWCGWSESLMYFLQEKKDIGSIYADNRPETHRSDCPWVQARKLLE